MLLMFQFLDFKLKKDIFNLYFYNTDSVPYYKHTKILNTTNFYYDCLIFIEYIMEQ